MSLEGVESNLLTEKSERIGDRVTVLFKNYCAACCERAIPLKGPVVSITFDSGNV